MNPEVIIHIWFFINQAKRKMICHRVSTEPTKWELKCENVHWHKQLIKASLSTYLAFGDHHHHRISNDQKKNLRKNLKMNLEKKTQELRAKPKQ